MKHTVLPFLPTALPSLPLTFSHTRQPFCMQHLAPWCQARETELVGVSPSGGRGPLKEEVAAEARWLTAEWKGGTALLNSPSAGNLGFYITFPKF